MKSKMNVGQLKTFLAFHGEKFALVAVTMGMLFLVYTSYSQKGIEPQRVPERLSQDAAGTKEFIERSEWQTVSAERSQKTEKFGEKAAQNIRIDLAEADYRMTVPLNPLNFVPDRRRNDPTLLAVQDLRVDYVAAVAANQMTGIGPGPLDKKPEKRGAVQLDALEGDVAGPGVQTEEYDAKGQLIKRRLPEEILRRLGGVMGGGGMGSTATTEGVRMAVLTGLVPFREQVGIYRETFKGTKGLPNPSRDFPNYYSFYVERAESGPDGNWSEWKPIDVSQMFSKQTPWGMATTSFVPESRIHPGLTFPCPNLLFETLEKVARHPRIPTPEAVAQEEIEKQMRADREAAEKEGKPVGPAWNAEAGGPQLWGGGMGGGGLGIDRDGPGGMGMGMGMGMSRRRGFGDDDGPGRAGMGMSGAYGGSGADLVDTPLEQIPEFLMLRFFDYSVQPNVAYRYRTRLVLMDPNNPNIAGGPDPRHLEIKVTDRLREDKKKATEKVPVVFYVEGPWSDPSPTLFSGGDYQLVAGSVSVSKDGPRASVMALKFDAQDGKSIPAEFNLTRGAVVGRSQPLDVWALDPSSMTLVKVNKVEFRTTLQIADIRGGEKLPTSGSPLLAPGEVLVITEDGRLVVQEELGDADKYYINNFPPPDPELMTDPESEINLGGADGPPRGNRRPPGRPRQ